MVLHELFEATAINHPDAIAVECGDTHLAYAQLNSRADDLAKSLHHLGVRTGDCVGMLLPRGIDLYIALLGILKAGAAYVPLDSEYPAERVCFILNDCQVSAIVTNRALLPKCQGVDASRLLVDEPRSHENTVETEPDRAVTETDLCYVIYTSGSTGRPKGVQIEHRSAVHLVEAEHELFGVTPADRIYQGFSIAFDASVEEVWLAFRSGATLVAATEHTVRAGPDLPRLMYDAGITVLSCVPTLLAMMQDDIPSLRLLIVGGESCPADLVRRWAKPGRRMVNTYGPTEATVIATYGDVAPDKPVTIGKPVPGYYIIIVDEQFRELLPGLPGEICIGGVALARGYVGRDDLTAERFVQHASGKRLYRTGDLGRWTPEGEIEFLGRIDTQIKLRGFRIELAEIESAIMAHEGIRAAVVTVREDTPGIQQLIAYVVAAEGKPADHESLRRALRQRLPEYMIPAHIETIEALPTLTSGKVNRAALPTPKRPAVPPVVEANATRHNSTQRIISQYWCKAFSQADIPRAAHFFTDLGGHSLLAATVVSRMRREERFRSLSVTDIYNHPTIERLAAELDRRRASAEPPTKPGTTTRRVTNLQYRMCGLAQGLSLYLLYALFAIQWITPYLTYLQMMERGHEPFVALALSMAALLLTNPIAIIVAIAAKWLIIGRYRAGDYPLWGWYYFRWWLVGQITDMTAISHFEGTPLLNAYYRLMGAKIGRHTHIGADNLSAFDLVSIGDHSTISAEGRICGETIEDGMLKLRPVSIGRDCLVGTRGVLAPGTSMGDGSTLGEMSLLPAGAHIPPGQTWLGSPARPATHDYSARLPARHDDHPLPSWLCTTIHCVGGLLVPLVYILAIFPGMWAINYSYRHLGGHWYLLASPLAGILFVAFVCLLILWLKTSLLGRVKPGTCSLRSSLYLRKWFVDRLMDLSLEIIGPLYATLYLNPWYSLLGAKLGKRAEISTACSTSPDLLEIGDESFTADAVSLGPATVDRGWMKMEPVKIGTRAFVGNSALIPGGTTVGNDSLVGVMTLPPASSSAPVVPANTSWLGSPAIFLPQRQQADSQDLAHTYKPTRSLYAQRLIIEFFRIALPPTCFAFLGSVMIAFAVNLPQTWPMWAVVAVFPILCMECGLMAALIVIGAKWLLMGRYVPREAPLWSNFVWRTELLTALHEHLANPFLGELIAGTPFAPVFFRMLGCQIGKRVYLDSTNLTEFDLIQIGDEACICGDSTLQTHLFEDRVMKMSNITIGARCVVAAESVVLYDTSMEDGSRLGEMSLLMKGESLPANTAWIGIPAQPANTAHSHPAPAKPAAKQAVTS